MGPIKQIAVIGAGAVGGFYGSLMQRAGHSVEFFTPGGARVLAKSKMHVKSPWGDYSIKIKAFDSVQDMQPADLVILSVKALPEMEYTRLLAPVVGRDTIILLLQNGINVDEPLQKLYRRNPVIGGLAFTCINRLQPNQIAHIDYGKIILGYQAEAHKAAANAIKDVMRASGIDVEVEANLRRLRWKKLLWNIPFNCLSVVAGGVSTDRLVDDAEMIVMVEQIMDEVRAIAKAEGIILQKKLCKEMIENTRAMSPYKTSMLIDYEKGREMEVEAILGEPLRIAAKKKVKTPLLNTVYSLLSFYNRQKQIKP